MDNIHDKLKELPFKKAAYFKWKYGLEWDAKLKNRTEEEMCEVLNVVTLNSYIKWEKSAQYHALVSLYLQSCFSENLEAAYNAVVDKATHGDDKAVRLMLELMKHIAAVNKANNKVEPVTNDAYADLEV